MSKTKIIFRADGGSEIGLGHVIRSLALAEMLKEEFECVFAIQEPSKSLKNEIEKTCTSVITLPFVSGEDDILIHELDSHLTGKEIVVLDGYKFKVKYQKNIKNKGCKLVCIDDIHAYHFVADVLINHSGGVSKNDYSVEAYTQCYLGLKYALLRPPFLKKGQVKPQSSLKNVFINMGGADPLNDTCKVVPQVLKYKFFDEVHVITGSAYKYQSELDEIIKLDQRVRHYSSLSALEIANKMEECGMAVCPPSSVSLEYASIGGLLFLKKIADNQTGVMDYFIQERLALDYDEDFCAVVSSSPYEMAEKVISNQNCLLDKRSDERLRTLFEKLNESLYLSFRRIVETDMMLCLKWANDPEVRKYSFQSESIPLEDHIRWFNKKLNDSSSHFYIVEYKSKPIGLIRFEGTEEKLISYLLSKEMRGKGLGSLVLKNGIEQPLKDFREVQKISGFVKKINISSCKVFEKVGFNRSMESNDMYPDSIKYELVVNVS